MAGVSPSRPLTTSGESSPATRAAACPPENPKMLVNLCGPLAELLPIKNVVKRDV
jgi:hypothetical protein